jgi:hypothetical protein
MIATSRKSQLFEQFSIPTEQKDLLHARLMRPKPPVAPQRLVLIAPLVGASASQALIMFRRLTRRGSIIMSFEYRGHSRSTGTFELDKTIVDTRYVLNWAQDYAAGRGLPLHGLATCFGAVPLFAQFRAANTCFPLASLSTISGLMRLDQILQLEQFAPIVGRHLGTPLDRTTLVTRVRGNQLDLNSEPFRSALHEYLGGHFPELQIGRDYFEDLCYDRADIARSILQLAHARYLDNVSLPPEVPCSCFFGRRDDLFGLDTPDGRRTYCEQVRTIAPHAQLYEMDFDHYGRGRDHAATLARVSDLFEQWEKEV